MSTEDTQTAAPSADVSAESTNVTLGESVAPQTDTVTKVAASADTTKTTEKSFEDNFKPKTVAEAIKEAVQPTATEAPKYTPNFKYKAALQEKEIEEFWRPLIKDQDSEKRVKEMLTRLDGFDAIKSSREKVQQEYSSLLNDYTQQQQVVARVESALERGDLSSAFRQLGLRKEDIFRWTRDQIQMEELPPEQRKAFEDAERARSEQYQMQDQLQQYQKLYEEQAVQARTVQLDLTLSRPEVANAAERWDSMMGQMGAFRNMVIQEAQNYYFQTQQDISAEQAVQLVMQKFGKVLAAGGQQVVQAAQTPSPSMPGMPQAAPQAKPVIPKVNGQSASPIKKAPRTIDDLKKLAKQHSEASEY